MIDPSFMRDHPVVAPPVRWVDDLSELYSRTKAAQAQAEQHGFAGTAAALADIAATLAWEPGVDPVVVWAHAGCSPTGRMGMASGETPGDLVTRH
jgi:hypothetical protein